MRVLAIILIAAVVCSMASAKSLKHFKKFKAAHGKDYKNQTVHDAKFANFLKFAEVVEQCNNEDHSHECGHNEYSDLSAAEQEHLKGFKCNKDHDHIHDSVKFTAEKRQLPASIDWRTKGVVAAVKNQGQCGSCYIFAATASLEGVYGASKGKFPGALSEQQALNCLSSGCNGGWPGDVSTYHKNGVTSSNTLPYTGNKGSCSAPAAAARSTGNVPVARSDAALQQALATVGPVAVAINASPQFMAYRSGIFSDTKSCSNNVNERVTHAVTAVGYDSQSWIVRNSWGTTWGEGGYIRMARSIPNNCGINLYVSHPSV
jgi:C1A family cysteine protease